MRAAGERRGRGGEARRRRRGRRGGRRRRARSASVARAHRRAGRRRGVRPHRLLRGLRQAHLGLRLPPHRPRRPGPDRPRPVQARRPAGGVVPGGGQRRDPAGHRPGPADPRAGRPDPHRRPQHPGRDHLPHRRGRARGLGGAAGRRRGDDDEPRPTSRAEADRAATIDSGAFRARQRELGGASDDARRPLSGHLRPDPQRPPRHHRPGGEAGRQAGDRRGDQQRQGAAVHPRGAGRDRPRRDRQRSTRSPRSRCSPTRA